MGRWAAHTSTRADTRPSPPAESEVSSPHKYSRPKARRVRMVLALPSPAMPEAATRGFSGNRSSTPETSMALASARSKHSQMISSSASRSARFSSVTRRVSVRTAQ